MCYRHSSFTFTLAVNFLSLQSFQRTGLTDWLAVGHRDMGCNDYVEKWEITVSVRVKEDMLDGG